MIIQREYYNLTQIYRFITKQHILAPMKTHIEKDEIAALFFLHYFNYTRYAFKKHKSEEDLASLHAHRTLMKLFGSLHNENSKVSSSATIASISKHIASPVNPYGQTISKVMSESISFIYAQILKTRDSKRVLEQYA